MNAAEMLGAVGRATVFTSAAVLAALALVALLRIRAPRLQRAAWFLAILPGWLLVPWTWRIETLIAVTPVEAPRAEPLVVTRSQPAPTVLAPATMPAARTNPAPSLIIVYLSGMFAMVAIGLLRYLRFVRRLPRSLEAFEPEWHHEWQRQLRALRSRRSIDLSVTPDLGPLLCFVRSRYLVLVPRPLWTTLARSQRVAILRHELAHWRRGDLWWSLAIRVFVLPQWFNPLAWLAVRRFDEAGEWACDDLVPCGRRGHALAFARSLLAAAEYATTNSPGTASIQGGQLARRVRRLVSHRFKEEAMMKEFLLLVPLSAIVLVQAVRIERVTAEEPARVSTQPAGKTDVESEPTTPAPDGIRPAYIIEPPDVLLLNAIKLVPKSPHLIEPFDALLVRVNGALPDQPIADVFAVDSDGKIDLGPNYGRIEVGGMTVDEARDAIQKQLKVILQDPQVSVSIAVSAAGQQIQGKHLVGPDGRVNLGIYGTVYVAGLTIEQARRAIEDQLATQLRDPKVVVDVDQYNSKKYYVITRHPGRGDNVVTAPITGNDTVLDALALVDDALKQSTTKIWISRPSGRGTGPNRIFPVNWDEIVDGTSTATNYQLLPGDRLFVVGTNQSGELSHAAEPAPTPQARTSRTPYAATESRVAPPATLPPNRVEFNIDILEDRGQALSEYDALRGGAPFVAVDSETIGPALRALASHGLIRKTSTPKLASSLGKPVTMTTGANQIEGPNGTEVSLRLTTIHTARGEVIDVMEVHLVATRDGQEQNTHFAVDVVPGKTVLVPLRDVPSTTKSGGEPSSVWLAITPSFPRTPPTPAADDSFRYRDFSEPQPAD